MTYQKQYRENPINKAKKKIYDKKYRDKESSKEYQKNFRDDIVNKSKQKLYMISWLKGPNNRASKKESGARRVARSYGATLYPPEHKGLMLEFYKKSEQMTLETGIQYSVDHIIPFAKGGGHTLDNVQIMTLSENIRKKDKLVDV